MAANRHTFIIRIWQSEDGSMVGQLSDPQSDWRHPFRGAAELWRLLVAQNSLRAQESAPLDSDQENSA